jgi:peptide chain release factor subunit 1
VVDPDVFDRLLQFRPAGAPVLSVYLAVTGDPSRLQSKLESLVAGARERMDADPCQSVRRSLWCDIARVLDVVNHGELATGSMVGIFTCHRAGLFEVVVLPRRARDRVVVEATPYLRPLLAVLDESRRYCVLALDRVQARLSELFMGEVAGATIMVGPGKPGPAGCGPLGHAPAVHRLFREAADVADEFIHATGAELIVVGGPEGMAAEFLPFLQHHLQGRVAGTFVSGPHATGPEQLRACAQAVIDDYERAEEAALVREALDRVRTGGLGAAGLPWCLASANEEAVQLLLIDEEAQAEGSACDRCGWLGQAGACCPRCGAPTRTTQDVIEEMAAAVIGAGGRVRHLQPPTMLTRYAVGAFLRFVVPCAATEVAG